MKFNHMNLKSPIKSQAKRIVEGIAEMKKKNETKEGVDLVKLAKTVARNKLENLKAEKES